MNHVSEDSPLRIGQTVPMFTARSTTGPFDLADYRGRWVMLFSHPADFTPVCTSEFVALAEAKEQFDALDHNGNGVLDYTDLLRSQFISRRASSGEGPRAGGSSRGAAGGAGGVEGGGGAAAEDPGRGGHPPSPSAEAAAGPVGAAVAATPRTPGAAAPRSVAKARSSVMAPGESWVVGPIVGDQRAVSL